MHGDGRSRGSRSSSVSSRSSRRAKRCQRFYTRDEPSLTLSTHTPHAHCISVGLGNFCPARVLAVTPLPGPGDGRTRQAPFSLPSSAIQVLNEALPPPRRNGKTPLIKPLARKVLGVSITRLLDALLAFSKTLLVNSRRVSNRKALTRPRRNVAHHRKIISMEA